MADCRGWLIHRATVTSLSCALLVAACDTPPSTAVPEAAGVEAAQNLCGATCVLVDDPGILGRARRHPDSADSRIPLADLIVRGTGATTITLTLQADAEVLERVGELGQVTVSESAGTVRAYSFRELARGVQLRPLQSAETAQLVYEVARNLPVTSAKRFRLVQRLEGGSVIDSRRSWVAKRSAPNLALASAIQCAIYNATGTMCGVTHTITPYASTPLGGNYGNFQSNEGTGPSTPIAITLSPAVKEITVTIFDPTYPGNSVTASGPGGSVSADFAFSGQPHLNIPDTKTLTLGGGISGVSLVPSTGGEDGDYVSYTLNFAIDDQAMTVTCAPVDRGDPVTCTASPVQPGVPISVTGWQFTSPQLSRTIAEQSASVSWSGQAAVSGTVRVEGSVNGMAASGEGPLTVRPRSWSGKAVQHVVQEVNPSGLNPRPIELANLGNHQGFAGGYLPVGGYSQVPSGPNTGVFFFTEVPVNAISEVRINRVALSLNSDFYLRQPKNSADPTKCTRAHVLPFLPLVEDHEGVTLKPKSHAYVFRQKLNELAPTATEGVVSLGDLALLQSRADSAAQPAIQNASLAAADSINGGTVPPVPYCQFRYF